jgi:hypothetical protein
MIARSLRDLPKTRKSRVFGKSGTWFTCWLKWRAASIQVGVGLRLGVVACPAVRWDVVGSCCGHSRSWVGAKSGLGVGSPYRRDIFATVRAWSLMRRVELQLLLVSWYSISLWSQWVLAGDWFSLNFHFTCLDIHLLFSLHIYSFPLTLVGGLVFFVHVLAFYLCFARCVGLSGAWYIKTK